MKPLTEKQVARVIECAMKFVQARIDGKDSVTIGKVTHKPNEVGMCSRFVRESVQAGTGRAESDTGGVFGATATETARLLRAAGFSIGATSNILPGDIVYRSGGPGHVAIYVGDYYGDGRELFAENTSAWRGYPSRPGTKITRRGVEKGQFGYWREVFRLGGD